MTMSAFLCNAEHIAVLAAFAVHQGAVVREYIVDGDPMATAGNVAKEMMRQNIRSVAARYPAYDPADLLNLDEAKELGERYFFASQTLFSPLELYKLAQCYEYQSCETEDWDS